MIHSHSFNAVPALYVAWAKRKKAKSVFTPHFHGGGHNTWFRSLLYVPYSWMARQEFFKADTIVCVSRYERSSILAKYPKIPEKKIVLIPNGMDHREFQGVQRNTADPKSNVVLYVGRLEKYKRIEVLIPAMKYLDDRFALEIVGNGPDKPRLVELVNELDLQSRVSFFENLPRTALLLKYAQASVFVMLSEKEACAITVGEALSSGTPCVVANNSALSDWIDNETCFEAVNPEDPKTVATQIQNAAGRTVVSRPEIMDLDEVTKRLIDVYQIHA
jgi:glycosyltransferase involved in cell wall biosynthesis